jgi:hypothetical protein
VIALVDTAPVVDVDPAEYARLLGYPPGRPLQGRVAELAAWARLWYSVHVRPWVALREIERVSFDAGTSDAALRIDDVPFTPSRLGRMLRESSAHGIIVAAVSAGEELEAEAQRLWHQEKPDEYFFLEVYGSAVVEYLAMATGARLCAWAEAQGMAILPHDSPGYDGWDIGEQSRLLPLVADGLDLPGPLRTLASGALVPKKSLLAAYGVTRHGRTHGRVWSMVPCDNCALARCQYRRRPYRHAADAPGLASGSASPDGVADARPGSESPAEDPARGTASALPSTGDVAGQAIAAADLPRSPLTRDASYRTNRKALQRWANERLVLAARDDGGLDARFRYDGTTCTNMGRELSFVYEIALGRREDGYPILAQRCAPAPGDTGHTAMCGYLRQGHDLVSAIDAERPLAGRKLDDVLSWARPTSSAGCYCDASSREHKWGLVLETIHYALSERERQRKHGERRT